MCLAIYCPAGETVPAEVIECGLFNNPDGAGYAIQTGASLRVRRFGPDVSPGQFLDSWQAAQSANPAGNAILHFRWATMGHISRSMSHPFRLGRWAIAHNGHISGLVARPGESDTAAFVRIVLPGILHSGRNFCASKAARAITVSAGKDNKVIALPISGQAIIAGESYGFWDEGAWYSNYSGHWEDTSPAGDTAEFDEWGYPTAQTVAKFYLSADNRQTAKKGA